MSRGLNETERHGVSRSGAVVGVSDHGGWAILVTVAGDATVLERRRVELVDPALPALPHHHEGQALPLDQALDLVERVRASAEHHAALALDAVATAMPSKITGIALRERPPLPPTVAERLRDYRSRNVADWVMYRTALADAAQARGWTVHWYDARTVLDAARGALEGTDLDACFAQVRASLGPPWTRDHKLAMAAAMLAGRAGRL